MAWVFAPPPLLVLPGVCLCRQCCLWNLSSPLFPWFCGGNRCGCPFRDDAAFFFLNSGALAGVISGACGGPRSIAVVAPTELQGFFISMYLLWAQPFFSKRRQLVANYNYLFILGLGRLWGISSYSWPQLNGLTSLEHRSQDLPTFFILLESRNYCPNH